MLKTIHAKRKIPLSAKMLLGQPVRLATALAGISFAGVLSFMQLGFRDGLFKASVVIHENLDTDIALISPRSASSSKMESFPRARLTQAMGDRDVSVVAPVNWAQLDWKNPQTKENKSILTLGVRPGDSIFLDKEFSSKAQALKTPGRVLFDSLSRDEFGPISDMVKQGTRVRTEVNGKQVQVSSLISLGVSFGANGNLITSDETFRQIAPNRPGIEVGLIKVRKGANAVEVAKRLDARLPNDVRVLTKAEFIAFEKNYWQNGSLIGFIFSLGAIVSFIVGCVIVYQVLYTDVNDHLPEYATLMAMGYDLKSLVNVVLREGSYLAILGYIPAFLSGQGLYWFIRIVTKLPIFMDPARAVTVFAMIIGMCAVSSLLAMRRLSAADPADLF